VIHAGSVTADTKSREVAGPRGGMTSHIYASRTFQQPRRGKCHRSRGLSSPSDGRGLRVSAKPAGQVFRPGCGAAAL